MILPYINQFRMTPTFNEPFFTNNYGLNQLRLKESKSSPSRSVSIYPQTSRANKGKNVNQKIFSNIFNIQTKLTTSKSRKLVDCPSVSFLQKPKRSAPLIQNPKPFTSLKTYRKIQIKETSYIFRAFKSYQEIIPPFNPTPKDQLISIQTKNKNTQIADLLLYQRKEHLYTSVTSISTGKMQDRSQSKDRKFFMSKGQQNILNKLFQNKLADGKLSIEQ